MLCYLVTTVIHIQSVHGQTCVCMYTCTSRFTAACRVKINKNIAAALNAACQGNLSVCHLGTRATGSVALEQIVHRLRTERSVTDTLGMEMCFFTLQKIESRTRSMRCRNKMQISSESLIISYDLTLSDKIMCLILWFI